MAWRICTNVRQEVRWHGASAQMLEGKVSHCKIFQIRNEKGTGGVSILLSKEWIKGF